MTGFSEFLINNMKSSLAPEDLKLFSRNSKVCLANKTELSPIRAEKNEEITNVQKKNFTQQENDISSEDSNDDSKSDDSESTKYNEMIRPKRNITPKNDTKNGANEINSYSRYRIMSNKVKEELKKKSNKVNTITRTEQKNKNIKNLTYDKSWKNLANKYDEQSPKKTLKSPERLIKNFMTKTLEKTKTIVISQDNKEKTIKLEAHASINKLNDSEATNSNVSKKVTTNPIYLSDSHLKKDTDKETLKPNNHHLTMSQRFSSINIDDLKPINASFSVMDNLDVKNFNDQNEYYEEEANNLDDNEHDNYNKLKYEEITTKKRITNNHKKSLQPTVKFEINQLLTENDCKILKNLNMKNDNENESDDEYELSKHINELHVNSGLFKALKILRIVFNKNYSKKNTASEENYPRINSIRLKKKKRKKKNAPSINGTIRVNGKISTNLSSKRKQILKKRVSFNKKISSAHSSKSKRSSKFTKSNQKLSMKDQDSNIYSNNMTLTIDSKNLPSIKSSKPESNYKYRSKLNPNSINLTPCSNDSNAKISNSNIASNSSMANSSNSTTTPLNNLEKCKLKNKEKLLSNWDKVIKKASNDPQSLKQLLKTNSDKALEESKKVKSPIKLSKEDIGDKSHTSLLDKINNKIQQSKINYKKRENSKETKQENVNKIEEELEKNAEKRIDEMLLNAKTAGKQGELIKNLFSYLNNYGDDGFTIKANLTSQSTPFVKSEVIFNNSPSSEKNEDKNFQSSKSLLSVSSASSIDKKPDNLNPPSILPHTQLDQQNNKIKSNPKSNFPYYLKCCVDKKPGAGSTIGSTIGTEMTKFSANKAKNSTITPKSKFVDIVSSENNKDDNNKQNGVFSFKRDKNCMLDIDQLIQTLEGDGQVEFLKKKLSLYIKSKNIINSTSTISQDFTSNAASSTTVSLNKKEISNQIENKHLNNAKNLNTTFTKLNINDTDKLESSKEYNENSDNSICKKEIKEENKNKKLDKKIINQSVDPSTLNTLAISSDSYSSTTTLDSPSISQINPIVKIENVNSIRDNGINNKSEKRPDIDVNAKEYTILNNLNKKASEMEMFYFDPTESPARKTLLKNRTEKAMKGFHKHLAQNSSTPNPENLIQSDENTTTLSKFYFSPESKTLNSHVDFKFKPPTPAVDIEDENPSIKPSFQYQHQNIFKTILRSKHFQTLRRTCDNCQNTKNECICNHLDVKSTIIAASSETEINKTSTKPNHNTKPKSKLQRLIHEFYLPLSGDLKKEKSTEELNKDVEIDQSMKNKTFSKIKTRTTEKLKNQMRDWANTLNIGTSLTTDNCNSLSSKTVKNKPDYEDLHKLNTLKVNVRLRSRVKKQLKQYEQNSMVGTKKKRSKRVEWRPLVGDQIPKSSKQILQEISVIAKNKGAKNNGGRMRNETLSKSKSKESKVKNKTAYNNDDVFMDSISVKNDETTTISNKQSNIIENSPIAPNISKRKI